MFGKLSNNLSIRIEKKRKFECSKIKKKIKKRVRKLKNRITRTRNF